MSQRKRRLPRIQSIPEKARPFTRYCLAFLRSAGIGGAKIGLGSVEVSEVSVGATTGAKGAKLALCAATAAWPSGKAWFSGCADGTSAMILLTAPFDPLLGETRRARGQLLNVADLRRGASDKHTRVLQRYQATWERTAKVAGPIAEKFVEMARQFCKLLPSAKPPLVTRSDRSISVEQTSTRSNVGKVIVKLNEGDVCVTYSGKVLPMLGALGSFLGDIGPHRKSAPDRALDRILRHAACPKPSP